jgi:hypothetical protein
MNVYALAATGCYGGGVAVVAAESEEQAVEVGGMVIDQGWGVEYGNPDTIQQLPCVADGLPRVLFNHESGE